MKLKQAEIQLHGERYQKQESMKHCFMVKWVMYPTLRSELVWDDCTTERGLSKKKVREKNAKAKKPYRRKKRKLQRKNSFKNLYRQPLVKRDV